jgi:hypothetical protein
MKAWMNGLMDKWIIVNVNAAIHQSINPLIQ